jgi:hypothetical protein
MRRDMTIFVYILFGPIRSQDTKMASVAGEGIRQGAIPATSRVTPTTAIMS